jgi:hypothetical protein
MEIVEQLLIDFNPRNLNIIDLEIMINLVTSISQITTLLQTQYNEQTNLNLVEIVEQLLIDFNPRNLKKNRCRNGQDYDYVRVE